MIDYSREGNIGKIMLNRTEKFNSINRDMALGLQDALKKCAEDERVRAVYLSGTGKAFCAGQDLSEATAPDGPGIRKIVAEHYNPIILGIRRLEKPVVCAVNGVAAGAGANLALCCDIVVASRSATFIQAFSNIGLIPDSGGTFFLPRLVGLQQASALMMLADKLSASDAQALGMIYRVFEDADFAADSWQVAVKLSGMPTRGLALTKKLLNQSFSRTLEEQLVEEETLQAEAGLSHDFREGVKAFLEKRKPEFTGK